MRWIAGATYLRYWKADKKGDRHFKAGGEQYIFRGTRIDQGTLEGDSKTAFGRGDVSNNGGTLKEEVSGKLINRGRLQTICQGYT